MTFTDFILAGGFCFLCGFGTGMGAIWQLARTRFLREGQAQGAALQRRHSNARLIVVTMRRDVEAGRD